MNNKVVVNKVYKKSPSEILNHNNTVSTHCKCAHSRTKTVPYVHRITALTQFR